MTPAPFPQGWYPVRRLKGLGARPQPLMFAGQSLFAARARDGAVRLTCPSGNDWRCVPAEGFLFAAFGEPGAFFSGPPMLAAPHTAWHTDGEVRAGLADVAENILDTTHTSVVHAGYLREAASTQKVEALLASGPDWISAAYPPDAAPGGWAARLIGAGGFAIRDTFRAPAIAEVLYSGANGPAFAARFRLTPRSALHTYVAASFAVPGRGALAHLKLRALQLFFKRIFDQDRAILELIAANRSAHGGAPILYAPADLLRPGIDAILDGRAPLPQPGRIAIRV